MRYATAKSIIISTLKKNPRQTIYISGAPGLGKTSLCYDVAKALSLGDDRVLLFRPSLRDPCDLMGIPSVYKEHGDGCTKFNPPEEIWRFRAGTGNGMMVWDELAQGVTQMQNAIAGAMLDYQIGPLHIDTHVVQIATGNRTQDKAGANRVVTQLGNRVLHVELEAHLDDWCQWAMGAGVDPLNIAFVRLRPNLLHDFNPDRFSNPTPRSWDMVSKSCDPTLSRDEYFLAVAGLVGEGAAAEYVGFRDLASKMPNVDYIIMQPGKAEVPSEPGTLYAVSAALAARANKENFGRIVEYLDRLPIEFSTMAVKDCIHRDVTLSSTSAFTQWSVKNHHVFSS